MALGDVSNLVRQQRRQLIFGIHQAQQAPGNVDVAPRRTEDIDGGLVGGASLDAEEFVDIWRAAAPG